MTTPIARRSTVYGSLNESGDKHASVFSSTQAVAGQALAAIGSFGKGFKEKAALAKRICSSLMELPTEIQARHPADRWNNPHVYQRLAEPLIERSGPELTGRLDPKGPTLIK